MIIRNEQLKAFQQEADKNFEQRAIQYLSQTFPRECEITGQKNLHLIFQSAKSRAGGYQCFGEQGIVVYAYLMFLLGSEFDSDSQLPWAAEILKNTDEPEIVRTDSLWQKAHEYVFTVRGKDNEYFNRAVLKVIDYPFSPSSNDLDLNFNAQDFSLLENLYPEKYKTLDDSILESLIQTAQEKAGRYGVVGKSNIRIIIICMFIFGSGFDVDLLYSWAGRILQDKAIKDSNTKISLLYTEAVNYLKLYLAEKNKSADFKKL